jgi:dTDP-4-dehydrorhamnose reductase
MRALVIGADGTVGRALIEALRRRGDVAIGTTRRKETGDGPATHFLDLADPRAADSVPLPDADVAFFCAAMTRFSDCRSQPELARRVNVDTPVALARQLVSRGARAILLSTGAVFDGRSPRVPASRPTGPTTAYGRLKADAERAFLALGAAACVVRLTKVLTPTMPLFVGWIEALARGETIGAFSDMSLSPISLKDAVSGLLAVADDSGGGVYQLSGATDIGYADAARHLARRLGFGPDRVVAVRAVDNGIPAEQAVLFTSLDPARMVALTGRPAPDPFDVLDRVYGPVIAAALAAKQKAS